MSNFSVYDAQNDLFRLEKNSKKYSKLVGISLFHAALVDAVDSDLSPHLNKRAQDNIRLIVEDSDFPIFPALLTARQQSYKR
jgi:hypothetical protein